MSQHHRCENESATEATDDDDGWGGLGVFEYSRKTLPHSLIHMVEHLMRGGHFAAFCTFLAEVAHKDFIKMAARMSRTEASYNVSQDNMLKWVLWQAIFVEAIRQAVESESAPRQPPHHHPSSHGSDGDADADADVPVQIHVKEECPLPYMETWSTIDGQLNRVWQETFISKRVRVTRLGLLNIMCLKLVMEESANNRLKLVTELQWRCFGTFSDLRLRRKFVGISSISKDRRDFVRLHTPSQTVAADGTITVIDTCWSAQILMFIHVSGFTTSSDSGIVLPEECRNTKTNTSSVHLALIRWFCPHPGGCANT